MLPPDRREVLRADSQRTPHDVVLHGGLMLRALLSATVALASVHPLSAQPSRISAPITDIRYEITADSSAVGRRQLGVSISFHVSGTSPLELPIPAWSPSHYVVLWFARRMSQSSVESDGTPLAWKELDYQP